VREVMYRVNKGELVNLLRFYRILVISTDRHFEVAGYIDEHTGFDDRAILYSSNSIDECVQVVDEIENIVNRRDV